MERIPVIDLFAGPGGLGEGFARHDKGDIRFDVRLSVEKDPTACATLRLRKFFRSYTTDQHRASYYAYVRGDGPHPSTIFPNEWAAVERSVLKWELGSKFLDEHELDQRIDAAIAESATWILVGGPPCQAYSLVGRSRMMGQDPEAFLRDHRHTLYLEYLKVLTRFSPPLFVMENVKGILSSKLGDSTAFDQIRRDLQAPARAFGKGRGPIYAIVPIVQYQADPIVGTLPAPKDFVVRCEKHGIPQARHRVILIGIRKDLMGAGRLRPLGDSAPVPSEAVLGDLPPIRSRLSREEDSWGEWQSVVSSAAQVVVDEGIQTEGLNSLVQALGRRNDPGFGGRFIPWKRKPKAIPDWYYDPDLRGVLNHQSRSHIREDLRRYLFVAAYAELHHRSPSLKQFPVALLPEHRNAKTAPSTDAVPFSDRFRVQMRGTPATTVTSHISRDGHYFIHFDTTQCRSLSVREAARLQTFPDNYFFEGNRTQQYHQVGNAVPPYLANQIAARIADFISASRGATKE